MTIMESAIAMNQDYVECSNAIGKVELFAEASYKEYEINLKEIALKVLKENGTEDDFEFLSTEAANGYIERAKKAIAKIVEAVMKFIRSCKDKLVSFVTKETTRVAVDKVDEACAANPKLRTKKVEYQNTDKQAGILQQGIDRIRKKVSKVKAKGRASEADIDDINEIEYDTMKKVAAVSVVTVVTLGTAVAIFKEFNSKSEIENVLNENAVSECDINLDEMNTKNAETAAFYTKASGVMAKLKKEKATKRVVKSTSLLAAIKKALSGKKVTSENLEGDYQESAIEDLPMFAYVTESTEEVEDVDHIETESVGESEGLDLDMYFESLCDEVFSESTAESTEVEDVEDLDIDDDIEEVAAESTEEQSDDASYAEVYMDQLESEIFGTDEAVETESAEEEVETETSEEKVETEASKEEVETEAEEDSVTESATEISIESLLDEMEALL